MNRILCAIILMAAFLSACQPAMPTNPKLGDALPTEDGLTVTAVDFWSTTESFFVTANEYERRIPSSDNTYYVVAVKMEVKRGTLAIPINLDDVVLINENNNKIASIGLSISLDPVNDNRSWAFSYAGDGNNTLNFSLGPEAGGIIIKYGPDGIASLASYHAPSPAWLIFLFEAPVESKIMWFQFNELPQVQVSE